MLLKDYTAAKVRVFINNGKATLLKLGLKLFFFSPLLDFFLGKQKLVCLRGALYTNKAILILLSAWVYKSDAHIQLK